MDRALSNRVIAPGQAVRAVTGKETMNPARLRDHRCSGSSAVARCSLAIAVLLVLLLGPSDPVHAQQGNFEHLQQYIDRTEEILLQAIDAVQESESVRARQVLQEAKRLHDQSLRLMNDGRPVISFQTSKAARKAAFDAMRIARDELSFEQRARIRLDHLRELYESVLERAQDSQHERALRFIREAERQFRRAREQYTQHNFEIAFRLLDSAEDLLRRAARLLFEGGGADRLERELQRTRALIDRIHEHIGEGGNPAALELLVKAEEMLARAREALSRGEPLPAIRLAKQARRLAAQAASLVEKGPAPEAIRAQFERWDVQYAADADIVRESGSEAAKLLLERAARHRQGAEDRLIAGDAEGALRQIKIAHDLLHEAGELVR
jgi:hypothetical protein